MADLPIGTVSFLYTEVEGSTRLWEQRPRAMKAAVARHEILLRQAIAANHGHVFRTAGDGLCAAFAAAPDAVAAALTAQRLLYAEPRGETGPLRVRLALHTGAAEIQRGDYVGGCLDRSARLLAAGHGGQILLSPVTAELVRDALPARTSLRDLGAHRLRDRVKPERVYQLLHPDLPADFPPLRSLDAYPHHLPGQLTSFVGRERELTKIRELLSTTRLLTLTGPGGVGKTRLALQAAADLQTAFADGVLFVPLASLQAGSMVIAAIAQALELRDFEEQALLDSVTMQLRSKRLLLVLDNFEHVIAAALPLAAVLAACPRVTALVTSRTPLHLSGEHELSVPPLTLPERRRLPPLAELEQTDGIRLFVERARAVRGDFALNEANAAVVAEICHRLDGLPLAIELAAARIKLLTPGALLARLEHRLPLLTGGARDLPARQQTLRATVDWSYDLLDEAERRLFRRLTVFVGGCTLAAAEAVGVGDDAPGDVLEGLAALIDHSLLRREEGPDGELRFTMLATIREYGLEQLVASGEATAIRQRHAGYYLRLAEAAEPHFGVAEMSTWLDRIAVEQDNLRAALTWFTDAGEREAGLRLASSLWRFWTSLGFSREGRECLAGLLAAVRSGTPTEPRTPILAKALLAAGSLAFVQDDYAAAIPLLEESLGLARALGDRQLIIRALHGLGMAAQYQGDDSRATAALEESLALGRAADDQWSAAEALMHLGLLAHRRQDHARARAALEESTALRRTLADKRSLGPSLSALGYLALAQGDLATARAAFEERLALWRGWHMRGNTALSVCSLGDVALAEGDYATARIRFEESLALWQGSGAMNSLSFLLVSYAHLFAAQGQAERALRLAGAASAVRARFATTSVPSLHLRFEHVLASLRRMATGAAAAAVWTAGEAMTPEQAIAYAREAPPPAPPAYPADLSPREVEVLRLVATGLTDAEVAAQLSISPRTVGQHLRSIYNKLGVPSRTAATRFAVEHRLA